MCYRNKIFFLFFFLFLFSNKIFAVTDTIPFGINLAGAEFGVPNLPGVYGLDYTYPTIKDIQYFSKKGFSLVRLPIRWERLQHTLGAGLDSTELNRLNTFIDSCAVYKLNVIIDLHNYGLYYINGKPFELGSVTVTRDMFADVWQKIALAFNSKTNIYGFDLMNQPQGLGNYTWPIAAQQAIDAIRQVNKKVNIIVEGENSGLTECWPTCNDPMKNLYDTYNKIIYSAHIFFDTDGTGVYTSTNYDTLGISTAEAIKRVKPFIDWLEQNNKQGMIGSFGVPNNDKRWNILLDTFMNYISSRCLGGCYWAAGPWWHNYFLSVEPDSITGADKPQMQVVEKHLYPTCSAINTKPQNIQAVNFYPNPFSSSLIIDQGICGTYQTLSLYDISGKIIFATPIQINTNIIHLPNIPSGVYIALLRAKDGKKLVQKLIKLH